MRASGFRLGLLAHREELILHIKSAGEGGNGTGVEARPFSRGYLRVFRQGRKPGSYVVLDRRELPRCFEEGWVIFRVAAVIHKRNIVLRGGTGELSPELRKSGALLRC